MISKPFETPPFSAPPEDRSLPVGEVHVWRLQLDRPFIAELRGTLALSETLHAERIPGGTDRRRFISGCGQLRTILGRYLDVPPQDVPLGYGLSGEPLTIRSSHSLFFDWARAEHLGLVAVSRLPSVTVEMESICHSLPFEILADHFFEPRENWDVRTSPEPERSQLFFKTWTGREALRRTGRADATVREFAPEEGFAAAVAAGGENWKVRCWEW